jgi:hypothetical protein
MSASLSPVPNEVGNEKRQPDQIVEDVCPQRARGKVVPHNSPDPRNWAEHFGEKSNHNKLWVAAQILCHYPVAVSQESDTESEVDHDERIVDGRKAQEPKEETWGQGKRHGPCEAVGRGEAKEKTNEFFLEHSDSIQLHAQAQQGLVFRLNAIGVTAVTADFSLASDYS